MSKHTPWHDSQPLSLQKVRRLIQQCCPSLKIQSIHKLGEGWDNTTWLVNNAYCFRFPKHPEAAKLLQNELALLTKLPDLGVSIPKPRFISQASDEFPYPFYGHDYLVGTTVDRAKLTDAQRGRLAGPLGRFLRKLHDVPLARTKELGAQQDGIDEDNMAFIYKAKERMEYLLQHKVLSSLTPWLDYFMAYQQFVVNEPYVLGHGDLSARHLLLDNIGQLSGIIDWGDMEILQPAIDISIIFQLISSAYHSDFWQAYGKISDNTRTLALHTAIYSVVTSCWYGHQIGDADILREGLKGLAVIKELLANKVA